MNENKMEPVVILLFLGIMIFTGFLFVSEKFFPSDGQFFQVIAGLLAGFSGAFFMRVKPKGDGPTVPEGGSGTQSTTTVIKVPGETGETDPPPKLSLRA